jgi:formylmethanofuran dehydrogenase subunit C
LIISQAFCFFGYFVGRTLSGRYNHAGPGCDVLVGLFRSDSLTAIIMTVRFRYQGNDRVPVEVERLIPEHLAGLSVQEIERLPVAVGNREYPVAELFSVSVSSPPDAEAGSSGSSESKDVLPRVEFEGDLTGVHWIGAKMTAGEIHVEGSVGRHLGSELSGGSIHVHGNASDWVGAEMKSGFIHVHGQAGHLVGAAYRGSRRGMTGGTILVDGGVGNELGHTMRRGLIAVGGGAGDLIGFNMLAGTILVFGEVGIRHGAGMKRGTIGLFGAEPIELLPSFRYACRFRPLALDLLVRRLSQHRFSVPEPLRAQPVCLYSGDFLAGGRGEIWMGGKGTSA